MGVSPNQLSSREGLGIFLSPALPRTKKHFQDFGNTFWYTKMHFQASEVLSRLKNAFPKCQKPSPDPYSAQAKRISLREG